MKRELTNSEKAKLKNIKIVFSIIVLMLVATCILYFAVKNASAVAKANSRNLDALNLEVKRIHVSKMDIIPLGYICQPFTDAAVLVYHNAMVPLTRSNGYVVTCAEAVQLGVLE